MTVQISLGTLSDNKISYLNQVLNSFNISYDLHCYSVDTGVTEKPNTVEETLLGAKTRAKNAYILNKVCYGVGLEGGMEVINGCYHYYCIACFYNGKYYFVGYSSKLKLPDATSNKLLENNDLNLVDELYKYKAKAKAQHNNELKAIAMIISRKEMFFEAIRNSILQLNI